MKKYIAYYRVSTTMQNESGLGLKAQKTQVLNFINSNNGELIESFTEIETGTSKRNRTEIFNAIEFAKQNDASLVIAKLDRLARNVHFVSSLLETGVEFVACDIPEANNFTIHLFAALAEQEAKLISTRTKLALAEKKRQGVKLGSPENLTQEARLKGLIAIRNKALNNKNNQRATALILEYRNNKQLTYEQIAHKLNKLNFLSARGKKFTSTGVWRLYKRAEELNKAA